LRGKKNNQLILDVCVVLTENVENEDKVHSLHWELLNAGEIHKILSLDVHTDDLFLS
jgi:hypothetical protein